MKQTNRIRVNGVEIDVDHLGKPLTFVILPLEGIPHFEDVRGILEEFGQGAYSMPTSSQLFSLIYRVQEEGTTPLERRIQDQILRRLEKGFLSCTENLFTKKGIHVYDNPFGVPVEYDKSGIQNRNLKPSSRFVQTSFKAYSYASDQGAGVSYPPTSLDSRDQSLNEFLSNAFVLAHIGENTNVVRKVLEKKGSGKMNKPFNICANIPYEYSGKTPVVGYTLIKNRWPGDGFEISGSSLDGEQGHLFAVKQR